MSRVQRKDDMLVQDKRLVDRVADLELWRRLGNFGSGGGGGGATIPLDSWHSVGGSGEPAFQNSWTNYGGGWKPLSFRKDPFGKVWIRGLLAKGGGNYIANEVIFTLPAGYRPPTTHMFSARANPGTAANAFDNYSRIDINTDGTVKLVTGGATNPVGYLWFETAFDTDSVSTVLTGPQGPQGPPGPASTTYIHTQSVLSATWVVAHNLSKRPSIAVVDSGDSVILPNVHYDSDNQITVTFDAPTSGKAYCN